MNKRGSALLIVLGVMAFVTASVVSFAVYMRESRLPSTFFRRVFSRASSSFSTRSRLRSFKTLIGANSFPGSSSVSFPSR